MTPLNIRLVEWIDTQSDGVKCIDAASEIDSTQKAAQHRLKQLKAVGAVVYVGHQYGNIFGRWCTPRHESSTKKAVRQAVLDVRAMKRAKTRQAKREAEPAVERDCWPVRQRIVKAQDAAPMRKTCAASVWELAA